jgi:hypothetical protein
VLRLKKENALYQIKKLKSPQKRAIWSEENISQAIAIYSAEPRAYRLLIKKGYPFPAVSALRACSKKIKLKPGILTQVVNIINKNEMTNVERICVLSFDEMKLRLQLCSSPHDERPDW